MLIPEFICLSIKFSNRRCDSQPASLKFFLPISFMKISVGKVVEFSPTFLLFRCLTLDLLNLFLGEFSCSVLYV